MQFKISTKNMVLCGMFSAIIAITSILSLPIPFAGISLTLQTFGIALAGYVLGANYGFFSTLIWILAGLCGLPVFSNMQSGFSVLLGPSGGFIFGFLPFCFLCGFGNAKGKIAASVFGFAGLLCAHLIGILQYSFVANVPFIPAAFAVSIPFLLKDLISVAIAFGISRQVVKRLPNTYAH